MLMEVPFGSDLSFGTGVHMLAPANLCEPSASVRDISFHSAFKFHPSTLY
jgi:hypothetical protein